jgi:hypothetical protein
LAVIRYSGKEVFVAYTRRSLAVTIGAAALAVIAACTVHSQARPEPQPRPSPNAPNPAYPPGLSGPEQKAADKKEMDRQNQAEVRAEVEKLYQLVSELREQVQKSDATSTLSISVVKKAHEIEKLAKQLKDRAKG